VAITFGGFVAARFVIFWLRQHFMSAVTVRYSLTSTFTPPGAYWQITQGAISPSGQLILPLDGPVVGNIPLSYVPAACRALANNSDQAAAFSCLHDAGFRNFMTYQPANRYWAFQTIETGIFVCLAAALLAAAFVALRRRDA
jgi:hypothetical protein